VYYHPVTKQLWKYDGSNFWSYDDVTVIQTKVNYIKANNLGGAMSWEIDGDDAQGSLTNAMSKVNQ
jgi:chitinase